MKVSTSSRLTAITGIPRTIGGWVRAIRPRSKINVLSFLAILRHR
jgi:hypothetical protein